MQDEARRALEAVIMVADQPADPGLLSQLVELSPEAVEEILEGLAATYEEQQRGFRLVKVAGGWRYQSHEDQAPYVERYVLTGQTARLSAAALETLAIVAYKQPISRAQVAAFGTTPQFLERLGLNSLDELPSLGDFIPGADVVELLEQGLRVDPDEPVTTGDEDGASDAGGDPRDDHARDDAPGDGPMIAVDLGDAPVIDLDAGDD